MLFLTLSHQAAASFVTPIENTVLVSLADQSDGKCDCPRCHLKVKHSELQNHMATHILKAMRGVPDQKVTSPVCSNSSFIISKDSINSLTDCTYIRVSLWILRWSYWWAMQIAGLFVRQKGWIFMLFDIWVSYSNHSKSSWKSKSK